MEKKLHTLSGLKKARKAAGLTQQEFADQLNVNLKTVRNWEQGLCVPEYETMLMICDILSCDLDYLAGRLEVRTHDTKTICDLTGITPAAAERLISFQHSEDKGLLPGFSHLIENNGFDTLVIKYYAFVSLMRIYIHLEQKEIPRDISSTFDKEKYSITLPIEGAIDLFRQSTVEEMLNICLNIQQFPGRAL